MKQRGVLSDRALSSDEDMRPDTDPDKLTVEAYFAIEA
jgi:hypothetical protein